MEFNGEIRSSCRQLIQIVSRKKVTEERLNAIIFQLRDCLDYVTEPDVKLSIEGLNRKFIIHAEYEKSRQFCKLVGHYIELTKPQGLSHPTWSVLHLLFKLAHHPTSRVDHFLQDVHLFQSNQGNKNVLPVTSWGEVHNSTEQSAGQVADDKPMDKSEDECWTSDSDDYVKPVENAYGLQHTKKGAENVPLFHKITTDGQHANLTSRRMSELIQRQYWDADAVAVAEAEPVWTEYQLLHEILWVMQSKMGATSSPLFKVTPCGRIRIKSGAWLASFSFPSGLKEWLSKTVPMILEGLVRLNSFLDDVISSFQQSTYTLTHQAYAAGLSHVIRKFYQSLSEIEGIIADQQVTFTLVHLQSYLKTWQAILPSLAEIHCQVTQQELSASAAVNHVRAAGLLSVLFNSAQQAQVTNNATLYPILLQLLFTSLAPTLNMIEQWFATGSIVDPFQEFFIERNETVSSRNERFWFDSLLVRTSHRTVKFLQLLMEDVLLAGRSVELLGHLGKVNHFERFVCDGDEVQFLAPLPEIFARSFNGRFPSNIDNSTHEVCLAVSQLSALRQDTPTADNRLLTDTFSTLRQKLKLRRERKTFAANEDPRTSRFQVPPECFPLLPLIENSLLEPIRKKRHAVCKILLETLYDKCSLRDHILALRYIHLMQAGDVMDHFCLQLFRKVDTGDKWENESCLTLSLLNCLSARMKQSSSSGVSVTFKRSYNEQRSHPPAHDLNHLAINYSVPWPVNLIITEGSLLLYNDVFSFLLQIKRALTSLQRLSFKEMKCGNSTESPPELLSAPVRQHRLQLLRAWLLHFVSSLEYYVKECVLESSHLRFDAVLKEATHLGQVADGHRQYIQSVHEQCLQHPSAAFLRDAFSEILAMSIYVSNVWKRGVSSETLVSLEEKFVHIHHYIAAVLKTDAVHAMLPQVDTLAAALIHSCPASSSLVGYSQR